MFLLRAECGRVVTRRLWVGLLWVLLLPAFRIDGLEMAYCAAPVLTLALGYVCLLAHGRTTPAISP